MNINSLQAFGWAYVQGNYSTKEHLYVYWLAPIEATLLGVWACSLFIKPNKKVHNTVSSSLYQKKVLCSCTILSFLSLILLDTFSTFSWHAQPYEHESIFDAASCIRWYLIFNSLISLYLFPLLQLWRLILVFVSKWLLQSKISYVVGLFNSFSLFCRECKETCTSTSDYNAY